MFCVVTLSNINGSGAACLHGMLLNHAALRLCVLMNPSLEFVAVDLRQQHLLQVQRSLCTERAGLAAQLEPQCKHPPCCPASTAVSCQTSSHASCHPLACHQGPASALKPSSSCIIMLGLPVMSALQPVMSWLTVSYTFGTTTHNT